MTSLVLSSFPTWIVNDTDKPLRALLQGQPSPVVGSSSGATYGFQPSAPNSFLIAAIVSATGPGYGIDQPVR